MADPADVWLRCSSCKRDLRFSAPYWECSVSTCNRSRTRLVFCSVACWDAHLGDARHRDAWAVEARAPSRDEWARSQADSDAPAPPPPAPAAPRKVVSAAPAPAPAPSSAGSSGGSSVTLANGVEREILIVVSKLKKYIKDRSGMNTSDAVAEALSDHVRAVCDDAIRAAGADNRKTVLDRDVPRPPRR